MLTFIPVMAQLAIIIFMSFIMSLMWAILMMKSKSFKVPTPFECGFSYSGLKTKVPFSIQFFMITLVFLLFDVEISILISMMSPINHLPIKAWFPSLVSFLTMMILSIAYEWMYSSMKWLK